MFPEPALIIILSINHPHGSPKGINKCFSKASAFQLTELEDFAAVTARYLGISIQGHPDRMVPVGLNRVF